MYILEFGHGHWFPMSLHFFTFTLTCELLRALMAVTPLRNSGRSEPIADVNVRFQQYNNSSVVMMMAT